jgi:1,4-dihydroxy-2-naphthoyl-CoA hydrolase
MIWFKKYTLAELNGKAKEDNILNRVGIEFTDIGDDYLVATMPVDNRTQQPYGLLHGGASCVLAETLGSFGSIMMIDTEKNFAVGSVITANHLRPVEKGLVTGTCRPVHLGRTKHVWNIEIRDDKGKLAARSELTCAVTQR